MAEFIDPADSLPVLETAPPPERRAVPEGQEFIDPADNLPQFNQPPPTTIQRFITNPARKVAAGIVEGVTGRGRLTDPETKGLPEISINNVAKALGDPSFIEKVSAAFRGEDPGGLSGDQLAQIQSGMTGLLLTVEPEAAADVVKATIPEAEIRVDKDGNNILRIRGKDIGFPNKPGFSGRDAKQLAAGIIAFAPAARAAAFFSGLVARTAATGLASAGTSVAMDLGAQAFGSEQGVSLERAIVSGLFGAGAEAVGAVLASTRGVRGVWNDDGTLTAAGRKRMADAGLDPDAISNQVSDALRAQARSGTSPLATGTPEQAAALARAKSFNFPARRGQITRKFDDFSNEQQALGGRGRRNELVRQNEADQNVRIKGIADEFVDDAGRGRQAIIEREAQGGTVFAEILQREAGKSEQAADAAWEVFRKKNAEFSSDSILDLTRGMLAELREVSGSILIDKSTAPHLHAVRTRLRSFEKILRNDVEKQIPGAARMKPFSIRSLEARRRSLSHAIDSAGRSTPEGRALVLIKRRWDEWLNEAFDKGLFEGDAEVLEALKKARSATEEWKKTYVDVTLPGAKRISKGTSRIMRKFIEDAPTDEQAVNWLFGAGKLGVAPESANVVRHIVATFGKDHASVDVMRQIAARRVLAKAFNPGEEIGGEALAKSIESALDDKAMTIMRELFEPQEIQRFREFAQLLRDRVPVRRTRGDTGSGQFVKQAVQQLAEQIGFSSLIAAGEPGIALGSFAGRRLIDWAFADNVLRAPKIRPRTPKSIAVTGAAARSASAETEDER